MSANQNALIVLAVILACIYVYFFTDWINRPRIQIIAQTRPIATRAAVKGYHVSFMLDGQYQLSSVKVVLLSAYHTNKFTPPLWHLIAFTNGPLIGGFLYGQPIPGMRPRVSNAAPQRLEPNAVYRLCVEAGHARGQIDFRTSGPIEAGN